ncbi:MAG: trypsin-like peptidase domain-containing protein [Brevirhabdus sp.]
MRLFNPALMAALVVFCTLAGAAQASLNRALDAVFVLRSADPEERFLGSGFLYGDAGVVITNAHVVKAERRVILVRRDGTRVLADVIAVDRLRDIAVLRPADDLGPGLMPGDRIQVGDEVFAIGAPLEAGHSVTRGIVSADARQVEPNVPLRLIQHDAALNPGSSGGALVDRSGRLVGLNSRIADGSRYFVGISYAVSARDLARLVPMMIEGRIAQPPALGLRVRAVDRRIASALGLEEMTGILVDNVEAGSPADHAGLMPGDVLIALGGAALRAPRDLAFALEQAGDMPKLEFRRAGERHVVTMDLADHSQTRLRTVSASPPQRVRSYSLGALGLVIDTGTRVTAVSVNSPAHFAGLGKGDVIVAVNGVAVGHETLAGLTVDAPVLLLVRRVDGSTAHVLVDPWARHRPLRPAGDANVLDPDVVLF